VKKVCGEVTLVELDELSDGESESELEDPMESPSPVRKISVPAPGTNETAFANIDLSDLPKRQRQVRTRKRKRAKCALDQAEKAERLQKEIDKVDRELAMFIESDKDRVGPDTSLLSEVKNYLDAKSTPFMSRPALVPFTIENKILKFPFILEESCRVKDWDKMPSTLKAFDDIYLRYWRVGSIDRVEIKSCTHLAQQIWQLSKCDYAGLNKKDKKVGTILCYFANRPYAPSDSAKFTDLDKPEEDGQGVKRSNSMKDEREKRARIGEKWEVEELLVADDRRGAKVESPRKDPNRHNVGYQKKGCTYHLQSHDGTGSNKAKGEQPKTSRATVKSCFVALKPGLLKRNPDAKPKAIFGARLVQEGCQI
jgi:hypothetical protein